MISFIAIKEVIVTIGKIWTKICRLDYGIVSLFNFLILIIVPLLYE